MASSTIDPERQPRPDVCRKLGILFLASALFNTFLLVVLEGRRELNVVAEKQEKLMPTAFKWEDFASSLPDLNQFALRAKGDDYKMTLFGRLGRIREQCGKLCQNAANERVWRQNSVPVPGANIRLTLAPDVNCQALMENEDIDAGDSTVPYPIPDALLPYYTLDGAINVTLLNRHQDVYLGGKAKENIWTKKMVEEMVDEVKRPRGMVAGSYGPKCTKYVWNRLSELKVAGKRCLVIGSERPWVESVLLALGAANITTLEYGSIQSEHPQIDTTTPEQLRKRFSAGTLRLFDVVVTHSSVEHSGLGRYGDALNPFGDLLTIARAWCVSKPDAQLYLGVPVGRDRIEFNAHRVYGKLRLSLLATNWIQIDGHQHSDEDFLSEQVSSCETGLLFERVDNFEDYIASPDSTMPSAPS